MSWIYVRECTEFVRITPGFPEIRTFKTYPQSSDVPAGMIVLVTVLRDSFQRSNSESVQNVAINRCGSRPEMLKSNG